MRTFRISESEHPIAAIATPVGIGGIGIVRISGSGACAIADRVFLGKSKLDNVPSHTAHFGKIVGQAGNTLDEVIAIVFRKPNSYTCEDVVEIDCHGGYIVTEKVLRRLIDAGARLAEPGEFTKRAFLNGRIDLSQAEAIGDLINSQSEAAYRSSIRQLSGELARMIKSVSDDLLNLASLLELELDFSEEDVEFANRKTLMERLENTIHVVSELLESYSVGRIYKEGVRVTIPGKPNVGKSSLLNALLQENRAIVSDIPGTTRDTISESISINGVLFRLTDTAGLRETLNEIEIEGVNRARKEAEVSDIILLVVDCSTEDYNSSSAIYRELEDICARKSIKIVKVLNKIDIYKGIAPREEKEVFCVSALRREGIATLRNGLYRIALGKQFNEGSVVVTNARHRDSLSRAKRNLDFALEALKSGKSSDLVALDLRGGLNALGEITGVITTDDIINNIFSRFCIGK